MNGTAQSAAVSSSNFRRSEDVTGSHDERAAKRLHRATIGNDSSWRPLPSAPAPDATATTIAARRRSAMRDQQKPLLGPRPPEFSAYKRVTSDGISSQPSPTRRSFVPSSTPSEPFLGLSRRMTSNFEFGATSGASSTTTSQPLASNKIYPRQSGENINPDAISFDRASHLMANTASNGSIRPSVDSGPQPSRPIPKSSPSKQRNPALRAAQLSTASASGAPVATPLTIRTRRQTQFPVAAPNRIDARQPRQSIGPGVAASTLTSELSRRSSQNLLNGARTEDYTSIGSARNRIDQHNAPARPISSITATDHEGGVSLPQNNVSPYPSQPSQHTLRSQPALRTTNGDTANVPDSDQGGATKLRIRRPDPAAQAAAKRQAPGLARTVSPTDAKKSKRVSSIPPPVPTPTRTPTPELMFAARVGKRSPTPPRPRQSPPSSFGTTSETNHNILAGRSLSSRSSSNSLRPPSSGMPTQINSNSSNLKQTGGKSKQVDKLKLEGLETVPPVPAIPKAYESPNPSTDEPFYSASESLDYPLKGDGGTSESRTTATADRASPVKKEPRSRRRFTLGTKVDTSSSSDLQASSRQTQQARLPPITLLPLSNPTSDKIAAIAKKQSQPPSGKVTPHSRPAATKTPTTPMTASRATFSTTGFERNLDLDTLPKIRPSTSGQGTLLEMPTMHDSDKSSPSTFLTPSPPFATPTNAVSLTPAPPATTVGEQESDTKSETQPDSRASRLAGFRSRAFSRSGKDLTPSQASSAAATDNNRTTPLGRRKLGLGWRRSTSKASHSNEAPDVDLPPKLPAPNFLNDSISLTSGKTEQSQMPNGIEGAKAPTTTATKALHNASKPELVRAMEKMGNATAASDTSQKRLSSSEKTSALRYPMQRLMGHKTTQQATKSLHGATPTEVDDAFAEEEMRKLASKKKEFETAAKSLEQLQQRASPKERVSPSEATVMANLNMFERGEIIDYPDVFFCGLKDAKKCVGDLASQLSNFGFDDERGDYNIVTGDHLAYRYEVVDILGKGSFGQVVRCIDHKHGKLVAVKIIRNKKRFHQQALVEVSLLQKLREWDPVKKHSNVEFTQSFYFRGHLCIATELLGMNLYEFIKAHDFRGFSLKLIRRFTHQILSSLCLLQNHKVIHCDLKPENILLVHPIHSEIKVIDFGSSCFENEKVYTYIQSRFYRSPEVILGMEYGMPIDMWSVGCILAELLTGYPIFPGENEQEQLACIMEVFGPPEKHLIERSSRKKLFFDSLGKPRLTVSSKGKRRRPSSKTLQQALKCEDEAFLDFITQCLRWDPERRLKPEAAMSHDFVTGTKSSKARATAGSGASSPAKRPTSSVQTSSKGARPLPEAPSTAHKAGIAASSMGSSSSPLKSVAPPRRHSTLAGIQQAAAGVKRGANGAMVNSALPRSMSGKPDLASAAAIASLQRQR